MIIDKYYLSQTVDKLNYKNYSLNLLLIIFSIVTALIAVMDFVSGYRIDLLIDLSLATISLLLFYINKKYKKYLLISILFFWIVSLVTFLFTVLYQFDSTLIFVLLTPMIALLVMPIKRAVINVIIYELITIALLYYGYIHYHNIREDIFSFHGFLNFTSGTLYLLVFWIFYYKFVEKTMENLAQLNREKTLLLNEIQHRVKNNFNMILSILKMQYNYSFSNTKEFVNIFSKRVESIVIAHDLLFHQESPIDKINIKNYITNLTKHIISKDTHNIKIHYRLIDLIIPIDQSIYLGIMLNEMLTNSLKYACKDGGEIFIILEQKDSSYKFIYYDSGSRQNPKEFKESLGIMIIKMAIKQLNGTLHQDGFYYEIDFKVEEL